MDIDRALKFYHLYENTHYDATCPQYLVWGWRGVGVEIVMPSLCFVFCFENGLKALWQAVKAGHNTIKEANGK